jgi:hypothetical protein
MFRVVVSLKALIPEIVPVQIVLVVDCPSSTVRIVRLERAIALPARRWMKI